MEQLGYVRPASQSAGQIGSAIPVVDPPVRGEVSYFRFEETTKAPRDTIVVIGANPRRYALEIWLTNRTARPMFLKLLSVTIGEKTFLQSDSGNPVRLEPYEHKKHTAIFPVENGDVCTRGKFQVLLIPVTGRKVRVKGTLSIDGE